MECAQRRGDGEEIRAVEIRDTQSEIRNFVGDFGFQKTLFSGRKSRVRYRRRAVYFAHTGSLFHFVIGHGILCGVMSDLS